MANIEQLRELLLKREQQRLDELERQLQDREQRIAALGEILPDSIHQLQDDRRLQKSLNSPLVRSIETAIQNNPKHFGAMLYPVIGPAIRRAVAEALKGLLESINRTMEHSFSARSWGWRFESWRTGVPFGQIVLKHTLAYSVDEVFLVQRNSGLLIARAAREATEVLDRDAVAAMLTAIQSLMQESFATADDHPLRSIEVAEHTLWMIPGEHAGLVALIQGTVGQETRGQLQLQLEQLHQQYEYLLSHFHVSQEGKHELDDELQQCLLRKELEAPTEKAQSKRFIWPLLIGAVLLMGLVWYIWNWWWLNTDRDNLLHHLQQTPGWVVLQDDVDNGQIYIRALRDPLAKTPQQILDQQAIDSSRVAFDLQDYQSMQPTLILQRLATMAGLQADQLQLGTQQTSTGLPGFSVNTAISRSAWQSLGNLAQSQGLELQQAPNLSIDHLQQVLAVPDGVNIQWREDTLELSGIVKSDWLEKLPVALAELGIVATIDDLSTAWYEQRIRDFKQRWDEHLFVFSAGVDLTEQSLLSLSHFSEELNALRALGETSTRPFYVVLTGLSTGQFDAEVNVELRTKRVERIVGELLNKGISDNNIRIVEATNGGAENNIRAVRVVLQDRLATP